MQWYLLALISNLAYSVETESSSSLKPNAKSVLRWSGEIVQKSHYTSMSNRVEELIIGIHSECPNTNGALRRLAIIVAITLRFNILDLRCS